MESASKQAIVQADETVTGTTEDIVYLQDFPTKLTSMLRLCANFTFGMEIHTPLSLLSQSRIRRNINSNSHYRNAFTDFVPCLTSYGGGSIPSNITHGFSPQPLERKYRLTSPIPETQHLQRN
jgi:hypothetical protein